ncbi:MAG: M42 family metallopeptidase [Candidatus Promineifilaceae bacterium]|jgi:putative aminopeptidase FrvX
MNELLKKLVEAYGPSGFEDQVRSMIHKEIESFADEISVDAMGNLIAVKHGDGSGQKIMVAAHMDEIGIMVSHITKEGFLRFTNLGGVFPPTLLGNRVQFAGGTLGIVYADGKDYAKDALPLEKFYIDVGASGKEDCPVQVGDAASFTRELVVQGDYWISKSMDDRIGCFVTIEALRKLESTPHEIYFVFSVQEEVGTRGAEAAANGIMPDISIAVDITTTGDLPESRPMAVALGEGPAIKVKDRGMIAHTGLVRAMRDCAQANGIPYQLEVLERGSTDARSMQIAGPGSAAGCLSIPCRYAHSQSEVVNAADVKNGIELLTKLLSAAIDLQ